MICPECNKEIAVLIVIPFEPFKCCFKCISKVYSKRKEYQPTKIIKTIKYKKG